jgi:polyhydroxybutyrate depolymerase
VWSAQIVVPAADASQAEEHFIKIDALERRYLLHLPPGWTQQSKAPVILMLHGKGGTPEHTGARALDEYGDQKGFIVVYPAGINRSWNDGRPMRGRTYDDVGFLAALIDELVQKYNADAKRVYVTGMSNGGFMSFALACRIPQKIAAIAPVAGSMGVDTIENCRPNKTVSVMMINGTNDPLVKFEGGSVARQAGSQAEPIAKVVAFWRWRACGEIKAPVQFEHLPDVDPNDGSTVDLDRVQCAGAEVVNYTVRGGGHTWPGGMQYLPKGMIGSVNRDFDASAVIVDFFNKH